MPNLSWADLKEMVKLGHLVESHSVSHADFAKISPDAARIELADSKKILDDRLEQNTRFFAYPYGGRNNFRPEYNLLVRDVGYEACFSAYGGFIQPSMRGYVLPRQSMPYFRSLYHLEVFLAGCLDWVQTFKRQAGLY
jgi:peptidoglycan/xylan/chitin deacetylase (PgdA/CDA1 family)